MVTVWPSDPGTDHPWEPIPIGDDDGWVDGYRGLWGLDTGDRFAGERAPAGPKYTRTGSVRQAWYDPLGFAGLEKVAPPSKRVAGARGPDRRADGRARCRGRRSPGPRRPDAGARAGGRRAARDVRSGAVRRGPRAELAADEARLGQLRLQAVETGGAIDAAAPPRQRAPGGPDGGPAGPPSPCLRTGAAGRVHATGYGETWAALSVGLLIAALAVIVWFRILPPFLAIVVLVGAYLAIEAFFSRRVQGMVLRISMALAIVTAIVLAVRLHP